MYLFSKFFSLDFTMLTFKQLLFVIFMIFLFILMTIMIFGSYLFASEIGFIKYVRQFRLCYLIYFFGILVLTGYITFNAASVIL